MLRPRVGRFAVSWLKAAPWRCWRQQEVMAPEPGIPATFTSLIPANLRKRVTPGTEDWTEQPESENSIPGQQPAFSLSTTINFAWFCRPRKVPFVGIEDKGSRKRFLSPFLPHRPKKLKDKAHGFPDPSSQACYSNDLISCITESWVWEYCSLRDGFLGRSQLQTQLCSPGHGIHGLGSHAPPVDSTN